MDCYFDTDIMICLILYYGGIFSTLLAVICLLTNQFIEQSLRAILLSFSISNMAGSGMFVFGITTYVCHNDEHPLDYIVMMTIVLSLSHLLLLILHYYITLTSSKKKMAVDFSGLIIIAWITSAAIGSMISVSTQHGAGHMFVVISFMLVFSVAVKCYFVILRSIARERRYNRGTRRRSYSWNTTMVFLIDGENGTYSC